MSKFNVGDKVRFIDNNLHEDILNHYPKVNTIGIIRLIGAYGNNCLVQWPKGSTSKNDLWWVAYDKIELVKDEEMTNEEIWKMLKPKMEKNGLKIAGYLKDYIGETACYDEFDVHNAIAIAYRSGYERAMKGRPFKFSEKKVEEKKKSGHWEPIDPENPPKEGTKVKYTRESKAYAKEKGMITLGEIGEFSYGTYTKAPGIRFNDKRFWDWLSFIEDLDCLDMWVEDDE